jgi:transposase
VTSWSPTLAGREAKCFKAKVAHPALATALVATVADPRAFRSGRNFSAWIGLVPKQHSSGGKDRLGSISKRGDRYLRFLFVAGALAVIRYAKIHGTKHRPWLTALLARRHTKVAAIALANKSPDDMGDHGQGRAL